VLISLLGQTAGGRVRLADVSDSGCLVYANCLLRSGDTHTVRFYVALHLGEVTVDARVVYTTRVTGDPETACVAGLEFVGDSAQQRAAIERLIAASAI
jgi:hypothetical protein